MTNIVPTHGEIPSFRDSKFHARGDHQTDIFYDDIYIHSAEINLGIETSLQFSRTYIPHIRHLLELQVKVQKTHRQDKSSNLIAHVRGRARIIRVKVYSRVQWNWFSGVTECTYRLHASSDIRQRISLHQAVHSTVLTTLVKTRYSRKKKAKTNGLGVGHGSAKIWFTPRMEWIWTTTIMPTKTVIFLSIAVIFLFFGKL